MAGVRLGRCMVLVGIAAKVYKATGMQKWLSWKSDSEPMSKARHDPVDGGYTYTCLGEPPVVDEDYMSWLQEHPSAISSFQRIINASKGKQIAVFLDYDGTLSPIVCDPDRAFMSDQMRAAVRDVSNYFPTAIISGRSREKVYSFVKLNEVYYSGSHGMDTMGPAPKNNSYDHKYHYKTIDKEGKEFIVLQPAKDFLPALAKEVESMLVKYPEFHMTRGKKVLEIRPSIKWNKGHALEYLLDSLEFDNILPIYIGDDKTDEDAFKVLRERGEGYPIVVSTKPTKTMAFHSLHDPSEVLSFLIRLGRWGSNNIHPIQG